MYIFQAPSFKSLVQKHFVRNRVFGLVNDLLKTIEDEKKAQSDLIESFRQARLTTNLPEQKPEVHRRRSSIARPRGRRKYSDVSLADRIVVARRHSLALSASGTADLGEIKEINVAEMNNNVEVNNAEGKEIPNTDFMAPSPVNIDRNVDRDFNNGYNHRTAEQIQASENADISAVNYESNTVVRANDTREKNETMNGKTVNEITLKQKDKKLDGDDKCVTEEIQPAPVRSRGKPNHESDVVHTLDEETLVRQEQESGTSLSFSQNQSENDDDQQTVMTDGKHDKRHNNSHKHRIQTDTKLDNNENAGDSTTFFRVKEQNGVSSLELSSSSRHNEGNSNSSEFDKSNTFNNVGRHTEVHTIATKSSDKVCADEANVGMFDTDRSAKSYDSNVEENNSRSKDFEGQDDRSKGGTDIRVTDPYRHVDGQKGDTLDLSLEIMIAANGVVKVETGTTFNDSKSQKERSSPKREPKLVDVDVERLSDKSDEEEGIENVRVVGSDDEVKYSDPEELSKEERDENIDKLQALNVSSNSMEHSSIKHTASLQPKLDTIAEASTESFKSFSKSSKSESKSVIEIQCKEEHRQNKHRPRIKSGIDNKESPNTNRKKAKAKRYRSQNDRAVESARDKSPYKHKTLTTNTKLAESSQPKWADRPSKRITLDLLGVYENSFDLQRVHKSELTPRKKSCVDQGSEKPRPKSPNKKRGTERRKHDMTPLPPKFNAGMPHVLRMSRAKTDLSSWSSSSANTTPDPFKYFTVKTCDDRYRHPDCVIWNRLDLTVGNDRSRNTFTGKESSMGVHGFDDRDVKCLPLKDAIKRVRSVKTVPPLRHLTDVSSHYLLNLKKNYFLPISIYVPTEACN